MKKTLAALFALLLPLVALAGERVISNPDTDGDLKIKVAPGGTSTTVATFRGADGVLDVTGAATTNQSYLTTPGARILNGPTISGVMQQHATSASRIVSWISSNDTDTGSNPIARIDARIVTSTGTAVAVSTRPLFSVTNNGTAVATVAASGDITLSSTNGIQFTRSGETVTGRAGISASDDAFYVGTDNSFNLQLRTNNTVRAILLAGGGLLFGADSLNGAGFYTASASGTTSCTQACQSSDGTAGFDTDSGVCTHKWGPGGVVGTCADTTNEGKRCLCVGMN